MNPSGASVISSSSAKNGRIAAWGHTKAHSLHMVHRSLIHSGTSNATPRFSTAAVPKGIRPSVIPFFASVATDNALPS